MQGQFNPMTGQMGDTWPMLSQIQQLFTVRSLTSDVDHIDKDVDVLMIVHPKNLAPKTLYAIDQFVMRGGKVLLFVDPNSGADTSGQDPSKSFRRRDGQSLLRSGAAARGVGRRLRSDQGDRRSRAGPRSAGDHAGTADAAHRAFSDCGAPTWTGRTSTRPRSTRSTSPPRASWPRAPERPPQFEPLADELHERRAACPPRASMR